MDTYSMARVETVIPDVQKFVNIRYSWYQLRLVKEKMWSDALSTHRYEFLAELTNLANFKWVELEHSMSQTYKTKDILGYERAQDWRR